MAAPGRRGACYTLLPLKGGQLRRLECCTTYRNYIFVGVSDGFDVHLARYEEMYRKWDLVNIQTVRTPSQKPVTQVAILAELKTAVVLCDGCIYLYDCDPPTLPTKTPFVSSEPRSQIANLRDCLYFTVKRAQGTYTLAAVVKRRVAICRWQSNHFDVWKDLQLPPEVPVAVLWSGNGLLQCFQREYLVLDIETGKSNKVFDPSAGPGACYINGFSENLILIQEACGARIKHDGKPTSRVGVKWSSHPKAMVYSHPYLVSLHGSSIEIHFPHPHHMRPKQQTFCQSMNLGHTDKFNTPNFVDYDSPKPTERLSADGAPQRDAVVVLSTDGSMRLMKPIPIDQQITTLFKEGQFDDAMALCNLCTNEISETLRVQLVLQHGNYLFGQGQYDDTISKFTGAQVDPRYMVSFFPRFMSSTVEEKWKPPVPITEQHHLEDRDISGNVGAISALLSYLAPQRGTPPPDHRYPLRDSSLRDANDRTRLMAAIDTAFVHCLSVLNQDTGEVLRRPNYVVHESVEVRFRETSDLTSLGLLQLSLNDPKEIASLLEQLKNFVFHGSLESVISTDGASLQGSLIAKSIAKLSDNNSISPDRYYTREKVRALVAKGSREMQDHVDELVPRVMAVTITAFILKQLDGSNVENISVIEHNTQWLLDAFPEKFVVPIFVKSPSDKESGNPLEPIKVVENLRRNTAACNEYLRLLMGHDCNLIQEPSLHDSRVETLVALATTRKDSKVFDDLIEFLRVSQLYNTREAIAVIDSAVNDQPSLKRQFVQPRTFVLSRLNRHEDAIKMLLEEDMHDAAVRYAKDVNEKSRHSGSHEDAFRYLLSSYVSPGGGRKPNVKAAVEIVKSNPSMDMVAALEVLPDDIELNELSTVLMSALRGSQSDARYKQVNMNLLRTKVRSLQVQSASLKLPSFSVRNDQLCPKCNGKFKKSNVVRYPNGTVVHQSCAADLSTCPVTGTSFRNTVDLL